MGPELLVKLGLNKSKYSQGLNDAEKEFKDFTHKTAGHGKSASEQLTHSFRGVHEVLKAFGAVTVFKEFISWFKDLSEYAQKYGDKTDANTRATIRWGQALKGATEGVKKMGVQVLGYATRAGEYLGGLLKGQSLDQTDRDNASEDAADAAEAKRDAFLKENDPQKVKQLRQEIAEIEAAASKRKLTDEQKVAELEEHQMQLRRERDELSVHQVEKRLELEKAIAEDADKFAQLAEKQQQQEIAHQKEMKDKQDELHKEKLEHIKAEGDERAAQVFRIQELQDKMGREKADRSKMTVQELANIPRFAPGVSQETADEGEQARTALKLKSQADQARLAGNVDQAASLFSRADAIIHDLAGPKGPLRSSQDPDQSQQLEVLKASEKHLQEIDDKIAALWTSD